MSFKRKLIGLLVLATAGTIALNVWLNRMEAEVLSQASEIAGGAVFCWVDGQFVQGDVPTTRLLAQGRVPFDPLADFKDAILHLRQAKPVHFGFVVPGGDDAEGRFWAWSYWQRSYWEDEGLEKLHLLGGPQILSECRGR